MTWQYGAVGRVVGLLELALGRPDDAERRLRAAVALCERMDARAFLAMARHDLGRLLLPSDEGRRLVDQARAAAGELGMPGLQNEGIDRPHVATARACLAAPPRRMQAPTPTPLRRPLGTMTERPDWFVVRFRIARPERKPA